MLIKIYHEKLLLTLSYNFIFAGKVNLSLFVNIATYICICYLALRPGIIVLIIFLCLEEFMLLAKPQLNTLLLFQSDTSPESPVNVCDIYWRIFR